MYDRTTYYFSPDAYFAVNRMPSDEDMEKLSEGECADLMQERIDFKKQHEDWYKLHEKIKADPSGYIASVREKMCKVRPSSSSTTVGNKV